MASAYKLRVSVLWYIRYISHANTTLHNQHWALSIKRVYVIMWDFSLSHRVPYTYKERTLSALASAKVAHGGDVPFCRRRTEYHRTAATFSQSSFSMVRGGSPRVRAKCSVCRFHRGRLRPASDQRNRVGRSPLIFLNLPCAKTCLLAARSSVRSFPPPSLSLHPEKPSFKFGAI